jgi:LAO/AO transport system kinase
MVDDGASSRATDLVSRVLSGEQRAMARLMTRVDDRATGHLQELQELHPHTGKAYLLGITGTPGAGKSTLVDALVSLLRKRDLRVGVLAVDPSSPFSGGAILGDRIRMQRHALDPEVFIRSISTRGQLGGLSRSAQDFARVLDAGGCDVVIVESVGVGQDELQIAEVVHSTVVVLAPGGGDDIQAIKAGILEIADVLAVNKADREGADATLRDLEGMLSLGEGPVRAGVGHGLAAAPGSVQRAPGEQGDADPGWRVPVLKLAAQRGEGVEALWQACEAHRAHLHGSSAGQQRGVRRRQAEFRRAFRELLHEDACERLGDKLTQAVTRAGDGTDPYALALALIEGLRGTTQPT